MSDGLRINDQVVIPRSELSFRFSRSSGPGGQGVNTTDSRVELTFDLAHSPSVSDHLKARAARLLGARIAADGTLTVVASEQRSQLQNRAAAEQRLVRLLADVFAPPPPPRRKTKPSRSSVEKRISQKKRRGETKRLRRSTDE